ncbi:MAG TPA: hypothetical protein VF607_10235 [Verrucomicrobiae bacterium]
MNESKPGDEVAREEEAARHQLPPALVMAIFGAVLGALPAGLSISFAAAPGNQGSAVYGLLLPWSVLPFLAGLVVAWRARFTPWVPVLGRRILIAAGLGVLAYGYAFLFAQGPVNDRKWFAFVPLWQWAALARPMAQALMASMRD